LRSNATFLRVALLGVRAAISGEKVQKPLLIKSLYGEKKKKTQHSRRARKRRGEVSIFTAKRQKQKFLELEERVGQKKSRGAPSSEEGVLDRRKGERRR